MDPNGGISWTQHKFRIFEVVLKVMGHEKQALDKLARAAEDPAIDNLNLDFCEPYPIYRLQQTKHQPFNSLLSRQVGPTIRRGPCFLATTVQGREKTSFDG